MVAKESRPKLLWAPSDREIGDEQSILRLPVQLGRTEGHIDYYLFLWGFVQFNCGRWPWVVCWGLLVFDKLNPLVPRAVFRCDQYFQGFF